MVGLIFPKQFDNTYRGSRLAVWLLVLILLAKFAMAGNSLINTRWILQSADRIPLDTYGPGADAVVMLFAALALCHLLLVLLSFVVLIRYGAMIPLIYLLLSIEQIGRKAIVLMNPVIRSGASGLPIDINVLIAALLLIGFALSLYRRSGAAEAAQ